MIALRLGDWRLDLDCTPPAVAEAARTRYARFVAAAAAGAAGAGAADISIAVQFTEPGAGSTCQCHLLEVALLACADGYLLDDPGISGTISLTRQRASLSLPGVAPSRDLEYFLRIVVALLARHRGGLLVHGAALVHRGRAHLFIGRSGSGKSTVVALSPQAAALSDDLVLLRPGGAGWTVYGTPFWNWQAGERAAEAHCAPLAGIYKLVQAPEVRLTPLGVAAATAELVVNCPIVNALPDLLPGLLATCRELALHTPVQSLAFRKDAAFWRVIEPEGAT